ncbi:MAG TPA: hypothetical protein VE988_09140 [Gemmataceae bacterium]|nr:hypothetical protein [Gemmataceae bacterium]
MSLLSFAATEISLARGNFDKLAEIFAPAGTPSIQGKAWVCVDTGPANFPTKRHGWLLQDDPEQITIIDRIGEVQKLKKPRPRRSSRRMERVSGSLWTCRPCD